MGRSGYMDCDGLGAEEQWGLIRWRGAVSSAMRGRRGQAFLKEMLRALDAMPEKRLIRERLVDDYDSSAVCALGAVGKLRGTDMADLEDLAPDATDVVARRFGIAEAMVKEIVYINDEWYWRQSPEERFTRVRAWIEGHIKTEGSRG